MNFLLEVLILQDLPSLQKFQKIRNKMKNQISLQKQAFLYLLFCLLIQTKFCLETKFFQPAVREFENSTIMVLVEEKQIAIYKKQLNQWLLDQTIQTRDKVTRFDLNKEMICIEDDQDFLTLYNISQGSEKFLRQKFPSITFLSVDEKGVFIQTENHEMFILSYKGGIKKVQTFLTYSLEAIIKLCPNQRIIGISSNTISSFRLEKGFLFEIFNIRVQDDHVKNWHISPNCEKMFIYQPSKIVVYNISFEKENFHLSQEIMLEKIQDISNFKINTRNSIFSFESQAYIYIYRENSGNFQFQENILKEGEQSIIGFEQENLLIQKNREIFQKKTHHSFRSRIFQKTKWQRHLQAQVTHKYFGYKENLTFSQPTLIDERYGNPPQRLKIYENFMLILRGFFEFRPLDDFSLDLTEQIPQTSYAVAFEEQNGWLLSALSNFQISLFVQEGSSFVSKQLINLFDEGALYDISINSNGILGAKNHNYVIVGKIVSQTEFSMLGYFPAPGSYVVHVCEDDSFVTTSFVNDQLYFQAYERNEKEYTQGQEILLRESKDFYEGISATSDCRVVVIHNRHRSRGQFDVLFRDESGKYSVVASKISPFDTVYDDESGINADGDIVTFPTPLGVEVWKYTAISHDYVYVDTLKHDQGQVYSVDINQHAIYYGFHADNNMGKIKVIQYSFQTVQPSVGTYGNKGDVTLQEVNKMWEPTQVVHDIRISKDYLVAASKYSGTFVYEKASNNYTFQHNYVPTIFVSSLDVNNQGILVQGGYDKTAYVSIASDATFSSVQNISSSSQILFVDLNDEDQLLLGHINGDISVYLWESKEFTLQHSIINEKGRVEGGKMCSDGSILALVEVEGEFFFKSFTHEGEQSFTTKFKEYFAVSMAATDDCTTVVFSSSALMEVDIFHKAPGQAYSHIQTILELVPLSKIAVNPDGDILVVGRHTVKESGVYKYDDCSKKYMLEEAIQEGMDDYAVQITDEEIVLGNEDGTIRAYSYSFRDGCSSFGRKELQELTGGQLLTEASRQISSISLSDEHAVSNSRYSGAFFYEKNGDTFTLIKELPQYRFISDVAVVSSLQTFVLANYDKNIVVFKHNGSEYSLNQRIETSSQPLSLDLSGENHLLVGMADGNLAEFVPSEGSFLSTPRTEIRHEGGRVPRVKMCSGGRKIALVEVGGHFKLMIYADDGRLEKQLWEELEEELVEAYLAASSDCSVVAVSGLTMGKVHIYTNQAQYSLFSTIDAQQPLSQVAIDEGDILVVASIIGQYSLLFHYTQCTGEYVEVEKLTSGSYDESVAMTGSRIAQGNDAGKVRVSQYSWVPSQACSASPSNTSKLSAGTSLAAEGSASKAVLPIMLGALGGVVILLIVVLSVRCKTGKRKVGVAGKSSEQVRETETEMKRVIE